MTVHETPQKKPPQVQWKEQISPNGNSAYTHMETHHIIRFKPPPAEVTPEKSDSRSVRKEARLAMKRRIGEEKKRAQAASNNAKQLSTISRSNSFSSIGNNSRSSRASRGSTRSSSLARRKEPDHYHVIENDNISVASSGTGILKNPMTISGKSKLSNGGRRGRARSRSRSRSLNPRSNSIASFSRRSISLSRKGRGRSLSKARNARDAGDGGSVCSARSTRSNMSLRSVRSAGSRVFKKVRSISKSASRRFRKGRKNKRDEDIEKVVFVKHEHEQFTEEPKRRKQDTNGRSGGLLGFLCGSFETFNLCGNTDEEDLIGKVIGVEDEVSRHDPDDPRVSPQGTVRR